MIVKNKFRVILLLILFCVWGLILYRFIFFSSSAKTKKITSIKDRVVKDFLQQKKDTFKLLKLEKDPFLNIEYNEAISTLNSDINVKRNNRTNSTEIINISAYLNKNIIYHGFIINQKTKIKTAMIESGEKYFMKSEGDSISNCKIQVIKKDSVCLKNEHQSYWIKNKII